MESEIEVEENDVKQEAGLVYTNKKEYLKSTLLGFFIGLAIIVPGVSGSTLAMLFKLYEKLLYAISHLFKRFKICLPFLLPIVIGILIGFVLGFFGVKELLNVLPFATILLFAGLMAGAFPSVHDEIKNEKKTKGMLLLFILGILIPIAITLGFNFLSVIDSSLENPTLIDYLLYFVMGFAISITQLVPGLSATALLMSLGYYTPLVHSVSLTYWKTNPSIFLTYGLLLLGFLVGLFAISKLLSFAFSKFRKHTFSLVIGLSLGSILTMFFNSECLAIYASWQQTGVIYTELILGLVDNVANTEEKRNHYLNVIKRNCEEINTLVNKMIVFAKSDYELSKETENLSLHTSLLAIPIF